MLNFTFSLDLENDVKDLNQINTEEFMADTAHQREDLIHRFKDFCFF